LQHAAQVGFVHRASYTHARCADVDLIRPGPGRGIGSRTASSPTAVARIITGSILSPSPRTGSRASGEFERRCMRRHLNSRFAFKPFSNAMADTDAPECRQRSINSRLNAASCLRRFALASEACLIMVCTCCTKCTPPRNAPSGDHVHTVVVVQEGLGRTLTDALAVSGVLGRVSEGQVPG
jgi:hypothetical protein